MLDGMPIPRVHRLVPVLALALALGLTGCGGSPGTIGPTGVDELTIPTPSPDPTDFVAGVDNRWLPLPEGARWSYQVEDDDPSDRAVTVDVEVTGSGPTIAGVATTGVRTTERSAAGKRVARASSYYAEDRSGNVWLLGQDDGQRSWRAGEDGAEAGVAMPAAPRFGDGFWRVRAPGVVEQQVRVEAVDQSVSSELGVRANVVVLRITEETPAGELSSLLWFAPDLGPVTMTSGSRRLTLVSTSLPEDA
jgi:hypothetical protein